MSKPFEPPEGLDVDDELERACAELDARIPDGYFSRFSSKLAAQLDRRQSLEAAPDSVERGDPMNQPIHDNDGAPRDEHSGLHEIKALADTTRERIRRRSSQSDLEDSLLSSSSPSLSAVALPDPAKSTEMLVARGTGAQPALRPSPTRVWPWAVAGTAALAAAAAAVALPDPAKSTEMLVARGTGAQPALRPSPTRVWPWAVAGTAALAAAAAAVALLLTGGGGAGDGEGPAVTASLPEAPSLAPAPEPAIAAMDEEASAEEASTGEADEPAADELAIDEPVAETEPETDVVASEAKAAKEKPRAVAAKRAAKPGPARRERARAKKEPAPASDDGQKSLDQLLDEASGPDLGLAAAAPEKKEGPDKQRLGSADVRKAMGSLGGRVAGCQKKTGVTGRVSMKFTVDPSGAVARAASASHAGSPVERCLSAAVKAARFPSFTPPAMSFRYTFLLLD
jgi:hypothetical protein